MNSMPPPETMKILKPLARRYSSSFEHRLIDEIGVGAIEPWMARGGEPIEYYAARTHRRSCRHARRQRRSTALFPPTSDRSVQLEQRPRTALRSSTPDAAAATAADDRRRRRPAYRSAARSTACRRCRRWRCARSAGTKSGEPAVVTLATKSMMDFFAAPSFQDGSGSGVCASAPPRQKTISGSASKARRRRLIRTIVTSFP